MISRILMMLVLGWFSNYDVQRDCLRRTTPRQRGVRQRTYEFQSLMIHLSQHPWVSWRDRTGQTGSLQSWTTRTRGMICEDVSCMHGDILSIYYYDTNNVVFFSHDDCTWYPIVMQRPVCKPRNPSCRPITYSDWNGFLYTRSISLELVAISSFCNCMRVLTTYHY